MQNHKTISPRAEHRMQEEQRVKASVMMTEKFRNLKAMTAFLAYYGRNAGHKTGEIKYSMNLANTRSVLRFDCTNGDCVGGDFDLSDEVAKAVATQEEEVEGEMNCPGRVNADVFSSIPCTSSLRYRLAFEY